MKFEWQLPQEAEAFEETSAILDSAVMKRKGNWSIGALKLHNKAARQKGNKASGAHFCTSAGYYGLSMLFPAIIKLGAG